ncbi:MAG: hypothetical protein OXJ55_11920 [Caldilineaceae bacterium]|nr:hypothetical protein [Caldilineaceae bacterium]
MNRSDKNETNSPPDLEEGSELRLDFGKLQAIGKGDAAVIPVAVQDNESREVLIVAYVNREALAYTLTHGVAAFWSTSRNELWVKGATSGDMLELVDARVNCEQNSLLFLVRPLGAGACHTKDAEGRARNGCYYRRIERSVSKTTGTEERHSQSWQLSFV